MSIKFMYITNNPEIALIAEEAGVDRIWVDLEKLGKEERQKNMNTVKSEHTFDDVLKIKNVIKSSELLVRIDPMNQNTKDDIEVVIKNGADLIMLPMFKERKEVEDFINFVNGRTKVVLLLETREAVERIDSILSLSGIDEIHIGLNDLSLSLGLNFMFEPLANGIVKKLCDKFKKKNIPYGFGGIARIGEGALPAEYIITEHYKLGSTRAILSRSFCDYTLEENKQLLKAEFETGIQGIKNWEEILIYVDKKYLIMNEKKIKLLVNNILYKGEK